MTVVEEAWEQLRQELRTEPGWHLRRICLQAPCDISAGLHQPDGRPGVIIEVDALAVAPSLRMPRSAGFDVETSLIGHAHDGSVRIILSLAHAAYGAVFAVLCQDTADHAAASPDPASATAAFVARLHVWQSFMAKYGPDGLSQKAATGLLGELHILDEHLAPLVGLDEAVASWAGPNGEPDDFNLSGGWLEIKTTTNQVPECLDISNAHQLDISRGRILLGHLRMRQDPSGTTLPEAVDRLRSRLSVEAPAALQTFNASLLAAGYLDAHRVNYALRLLAMRLDLFEVTPDFPHIALGELRPGIRRCSYAIELDACEPWRTSVAALEALAGRADG